MDAFADLAPSAENWTAIRDALNLSGSALESALATAREPLRRWPATVRRLDAESPWLAGIFDGTFDPRLELVGWATVHHQRDYRYEEHLNALSDLAMVRLFAHHLDPTFDPPDAVLDSGNEIRYASGCGGGTAWEKRGGATQWLSYHNAATEHSADMETNESWTAHGLAEGIAVEIRRRDYIGGTYELTATGPAPLVFAIPRVWTALNSGSSLDDARALLASIRMPWS